MLIRAGDPFTVGQLREVEHKADEGKEVAPAVQTPARSRMADMSAVAFDVGGATPLSASRLPPDWLGAMAEQVGMHVRLMG